MSQTFQRVEWDAHWTNGGTGVNRHWPNHEPDIELAESVRLFNDPNIFMMNKDNELHTTRNPVDLSDFWAFHRARKTK